MRMHIENAPEPMKENALNLSVLLTLLLVYTILLAAPDLLAPSHFYDDGAASFITLALIGAGMGVCLFHALDNVPGKRLDWWLLALVYSVYLMREADFHTGFSGESLTKLATYSMPEVPLGIRIVAAVVLLLMAASLVYLLVRHARALLGSIAGAEPRGIAFLLWFLLLLASQIFDREISTGGAHWKLTAVEELLELSAAIFALLALGQIGRTGHHEGG